MSIGISHRWIRSYDAERDQIITQMDKWIFWLYQPVRVGETIH
jgi:GH25 family lysozyme M1 (1,4-beta-N-acetylmuramidase)